MSVRAALVLAVVLSAVGLGSGQVGAQEFQSLGSQQLLERLDAQDQRIRELESRLNTTEKP